MGYESELKLKTTKQREEKSTAIRNKDMHRHSIKHLSCDNNKNNSEDDMKLFEYISGTGGTLESRTHNLYFLERCTG